MVARRELYRNWTWLHGRGCEGSSPMQVEIALTGDSAENGRKAGNPTLTHVQWNGLFPFCLYLRRLSCADCS